MIVLGFDTATPATAVGLMLDDGSVPEARDDPPAGDRPGHSTRLLPLAHALLRQSDAAWSAVERIAVGVGPGTFTGLRIGVSTARALAQSLRVDLVGVSSTRALADAAAGHEGPAGHGVLADAAAGRGAPAVRGVLAVIDARRGEVFAAAYRAREELVAPRALSPERLHELLERADGARRPSEWIAVGDGALRYAEALLDLGVSVPPGDSPLHAVRGASICRLGAAALAPRGPAGVRPSYGRAPDAEAALQEAR